jgi:hypothetical protein
VALQKSEKYFTLSIEVQGVGHAPALMEDDQINAIKNWLLE